MIEIVELKGSPYEIGLKHGQYFAKEIKELYKIRMDSAIGYAKIYGQGTSEGSIIKFANYCFSNIFNYDKSAIDELRGLSEGSGLKESQLIAMQGLTDFRDLMCFYDSSDECTTLCIDKSKTKDNKMIVAQTWDLATSNMPYVVGLKKSYNNGMKTCSLTVVGCPDMAGMNNFGICTLTNNLKSVNNRLGVPYLNILSKSLRENRISQSLKDIIGCDRVGGHYYLIADGEKSYGIECTADWSEIIKMKRGKIVHTNHYITDLKEYEYAQGNLSSISRYDTVNRLCNGTRHTYESVKKIFMDESCGENSINRKDYDGISTNGSIIMIPDDRKLYLSRGYPDEADWVEVNLNED
jgi:hypothetical protein